MTSLTQQKEEKRELFRSKRENLSREEVLKKSQQIHKNLTELSKFRESDSISIYVAKKKSNEVETREIIKSLIKEGKNVLIPFVDGENLKLHLLKDPDSELDQGAFGVLEPKPKQKTPFPLQKVDLIIVPGLAFDLEGHRLGYGKGYYDRLLKQAPSRTTFVGLSYEFQISEKIPHNEEDVPIHKIVTEERTIHRDKEK